MYRVQNKTAAIKEIQRNILRAGYATDGMIISGIYDENTRTAVTKFQKDKMLEESGFVDEATFTALYELAEKERLAKELRDNLVSMAEFPIKRGEHSAVIASINYMLNNLLMKYGSSIYIHNKMHFGDETSSAIKLLRRIYMLPDSSVIDEELYLRIFNDHRSAYQF